MKISWVNVIIATLISALLAWWLGTMGIDTLQKWLLGGLGGFIIEVGLIGSMGLRYENERSGSQIRIVMSGMAVIGFLASCIYSFFQFSAIGFCLPMGIFVILALFLAKNLYHTGM